MKRHGADTVNSGSRSAAEEEPTTKKIKLDDAATLAGRPAELIGQDASDKMERRKVKKAIKSNAKALDLRDWILAVVLGNPAARWLNVKNPQNIKHFVVLNVLGIDREQLDLANTTADQNSAYPITVPSTSQALPSLHTLFSHACPSRAPGDQYKLHSVLHEFLQTPLLADEKMKQKKERAKRQKSTAFTNDPSMFLLSPLDMLSHSYRLPTYVELPKVVDDPQGAANGWMRAPPVSLPEGWVETPQVPLLDPRGNAAKQKIWAMDCEMVETTAGRELGRISIVDFGTSVVLFDQLVKPSNPVTSYLTAYSGLSEEILSGATLTLIDVQLRLTAPGMIDSSTILLGHSLENDLSALKLAHPKVADTAILFHHPRGPPSKPSLKWLAQKFLEKTIQTSESGHDSVEDATSCAELFSLKLQNGIQFGRFDQENESIFESMARKGLKSAYIGPGANTLGSKASTKVDCTGDGQVMDAVFINVSTHEFVFARLPSLADALGWSRQVPSQAPSVNETLEGLDVQLRKLYSSLPAYTALCVFTGHSDPRRMAELNKRKIEWDVLTRTKTPSEVPREEWWTTQDGRELENEAEHAKAGLVFFCITLPKVGK
ncbi:hypothetical protein FRB98_004470 [Tulasnella sp. 332]|nr:hypothetical protein FRB98_004470 [Tulasnella sp. 332]